MIPDLRRRSMFIATSAHDPRPPYDVHVYRHNVRSSLGSTSGPKTWTSSGGRGSCAPVAINMDLLRRSGILRTCGYKPVAINMDLLRRSSTNFVGSGKPTEVRDHASGL